MTTNRDYYEILGVDKTATQEDIKRAYRKLAFECHPDHNPNDKASEEQFKEATEAYEVLKDPERRQRYDRYGHAGGRDSGFGFNFGGNFALFPSTTADYFGTKNLGMNYGLVFTGYGAAGVLGSLIPGLLAGSDNGFVWVFVAVGLASLVTFGMAMLLKAPKRASETAETAQ